MPFDRNGNWQSPSIEDVESFKQAITSDNLDKNTTQILPTKELVQAIEESAAPPDPNMSSADFFQAVSRIQGPADIVIPIYGGLHVLKPCIESIQNRTTCDYRLILVDDCSPDPETLRYLDQLEIEYAENRPDEHLTVLRNQKNRGFAASVNRGVMYGSNPYVVVLNSDVLVTDSWLTKILIAMESNPKNVVVNPATNNTALINVPMYPGKNYLDMNRALERQGAVRYPEIMPTGFCLTVRREIWEEIGPFDEAFGSYGEESDWWFRAIKAVDEEGFLKGYRAVLADNCYLFHERGTSFSQLGEGAHTKQRRAGSDRFHNLHPDFHEWHKGFDQDSAVGMLRKNIPKRAFHNEYKGNIAWAVKSTGPCGGMFYITDLANQLIEEGYNVKICLIPDEEIEGGHPVIGSLRCKPFKFESKQEFVARFSDDVFSEGILLSAVTELAPACGLIGKENDKIRVLNHVQSWDVDLANEIGRPEMIDEVTEQYRNLPNVAVSDAIAEKIKKVGGELVRTIYPGVNPDLFHDRGRDKRGDERLTVGIILLEHYPFKGYARGVEMVKHLVKHIQRNHDEVRILAIGVEALPEVPGVTCVGSVSQAKMADLMGAEIDILIDPSTAHSYGLPGLEALYSGARYVCWENDGVRSYKEYFYDDDICVLPADTSPEAAARDIAADFHLRADERTELDQAALTDHNRKVSTRRFIEDIVGSNQNANELASPYKIRVISPHMRKHGGPTTLISAANLLAEAGHDSSLAMVYTDWNPEVIAGAYVPVSTRWDKIPAKTDAVVINSDNPYAAQIMAANTGPKYVMYKLSHNPRFKEIETENLNLPWDHIVTSTEWLREACLDQTEDWEYKTWGPDKVTNVGWYHYGHPIFNKSPDERAYGNPQVGFRVGTLIHGHPLKGTETALAAMHGLKRKYEANFHAVGVGEQSAKLPWHMQFFKNCNRLDMAHIFQQLDVWLGASHSEGLGRMALENMSAGVAVVTTDTGAEFLKHEENCLLYEVGDGQAAADAVDRLVNDSELFFTIVRNGYQTAVESSNWYEYQTNLLAVLDGVIKDG
jgi:GT2 family glycosyltransferase/glycosyltransferase involved in cell wall biosynthesis